MLIGTVNKHILQNDIKINRN